MPYNKAVREIVKSFQSNDNNNTSPVVLGWYGVLGFHDYFTTDRIGVSSTKAEINTRGQMIF